MLSAPIKEPWLPTDEEEEMLEGLLAREESWDASRKSKMQWNVGLDAGKTGEAGCLVQWAGSAPACPVGACHPAALLLCPACSCGITLVACAGRERFEQSRFLARGFAFAHSHRCTADARLQRHLGWGVLAPCERFHVEQAWCLSAQ